MLVSVNHLWGCSIKFRLVVRNSNPSHNSLGEPLIKIIRLIQNIGFTTSPDRTKITPENIWATIDQMGHDIPTIWSLVYNGFFSSIFITQNFILSGYIHAYHQDIYVNGHSMRLHWYHQNSCYWKHLIWPTMALNIEMADVEWSIPWWTPYIFSLRKWYKYYW